LLAALPNEAAHAYIPSMCIGRLIGQPIPC
jgi:hypothetical protein